MTSSSTNVKQIRTFGLVAFLFFGCLSGLGILTQKPLPTYLFGLLSMLGIGFIVFPSRLKVIYDTWLKIANGIGRIIILLALVLTYYVIITPTALLKRVFGGRPISLKPDRNTSSYWVPRSEPAQPKDRFLKRYWGAKHGKPVSCFRILGVFENKKALLAAANCYFPFSLRCVNRVYWNQRRCPVYLCPILIL